MNKYTYLPFFQNLYRQQKQKYHFNAQTLEEVGEWRDAFRKELGNLLGLGRLQEMFGNRIPLVEKQSEVQENGYRRICYVMETLPEVWMPFYMLIPDAVTGAAPTMVTIPAHGSNKNVLAAVGETSAEQKLIEESPQSCYGREFVRRGYVVFCPDPPGYGERVEPIPREDKVFMPDKGRSSLDSSCKDLAQTAEALGLSLTALEIWDLQRLLDFAACQPEVNSGRIGCAGFSGGGQYTMWLAAMDDRIRLAVVSGYVHGYYDSILDCHLCPCNYAPHLWTLGDISDICSLLSPRPLFVENGLDDVENGPEGIAGPNRQVERIRDAYAVFGAEDCLEHSTPAGPHQWYGTCYEFVRRRL